MLGINSVEVSEYGDGVVDATTGELVKIQDAPLPVSYELATKALAECTRLDECKDWANKAEALASYARQSKDDRLRKMAIRIQARAIRRCGELLREIESGQGTRTDKLHDGAVAKSTRTQAAETAGLSERQKVTALRVANVPEPVFTAAVESESPPTVTQLADAGRQKKPEPLHDLEGIDPYLYARATEWQGSIKRLAEYCRKHDPKAIAGAFKPHEIQPLRAAIADVESWIDRFVVNL